MDAILEYLKQTYAPLGMIVYGSYADGSQNANSDFDVLVITKDGVAAHDHTVVDGCMLDAFIYPREKLAETFTPQDFLQIGDGVILSDTNGFAAALVKKVRAYIESLPLKSREENLVNVAWCEKMLLRTERGDAEGYFRWHWLLTESLEIYCDLCGQRYLGAKKSIRRMQDEDPISAQLYTEALAALDREALARWVARLRTFL